MGDTLAKLAGNSNNKESKKKKKRKLEDDGKRKKDRKEKKRKKEIKQFYTDEELFVATGGARFGMRARRKQEGKWARAESAVCANEEAKAKAAMEWDGTGKAKFVSKTSDNLLNDTSASKIKLQDANEREAKDKIAINKEEKKKKKKKKDSKKEKSKKKEIR